MCRDVMKSISLALAAEHAEVIAFEVGDDSPVRREQTACAVGVFRDGVPAVRSPPVLLRLGR